MADTGNNRIQLFRRGATDGITVAGKNSSANFTLNKPTSIILDGDNNLYIVDSGNHRIVRSGSDGFQCLIGCSQSSCQAYGQLCSPLTAHFDSYGNIYVVNQNITAIQKFVLSNHLCCK